MHRAEATFTKPTMTDKEEVSAVNNALAQWMARISTRYPMMKRSTAILVIAAIPTLFLLGTIVSVILGQYIVAGILTTLFFVCVVVFLHGGANTNTLQQHQQPTSQQALRRSSQKTLEFRFGQARAKRFDGYDVYLPQGATTGTIACAFLLIPDQNVSHEAYSNIAALLSDAGILVVVQNTDPHQLPSALTGSSLDNLKDIQEQVNKDYSIKEWAIGGHGMGSIPAAVFCESLGMNKLVVWSAYSPWPVDLSKTNDLGILSMIGTQDGYWISMKEKQWEQYKATFPPPNERTVFMEMIEGGNHAGFAHSGPIPGDGQASLRLEAQQKQAAKVTALFLKNVPSTYAPPSTASV